MSPDEEMVTTAALEIEMRVKDKQAIPYLIEGLKHRNPKVGFHLTQALRNLAEVRGGDYDIFPPSSQEEREKVIKNWELWWQQAKLFFGDNGE